MTADEFVARLEALATPAQQEKYLRQFGFAGDVIGVRMGQVFELAKEFQAMPLDQIEELLDSDVHEARVGGVKIMAGRLRHAAHRTSDAASCSTCTCAGTTGSTPGTWSTSAPSTWSGAGWSTGRATCCSR
jgi:DNA alkylation repair enzyme